MKPKAFVIDGGNVCQSDEENGTTRPTWRAKVQLQYRGKDGSNEYVVAQGGGKAPHVAASRAIAEAIARANR